MNLATRARSAAFAISLSIPLALGVGCSKEPAPAAGGQRLVIGFVQTGNESGWRRAHTLSLESEAEKRGIDLRTADAENQQINQINAIRNFITQGVDAIVLAPVVASGWEPVLKEAKAAGIPVFLSDRRIDSPDESLYVCFIGSDFVEEGRMAARWLVEAVEGKAKLVELVGEPGSAPAIDRNLGFMEVVREHPGIEIIDSQTAQFRLDRGKIVMKALLNKHGDAIEALFAHNDDMALGAIQAIEEAGKKPGEDIIIVSIDALKTAFEAMVAGKLNATVECNPLLGPGIFDAVEKHFAGESLPKKTYIKDRLFDRSVAAETIDSRIY
jgi:simple sugar transport system substrate-binding protein